MFDIGFWELLLIGVIGLVVLGPERLPVAIRTLKEWISGVRRFSDGMKNELKEELRVHELHSHLKQAENANMKNLSPEIANSLKELQEAADMVNNPYKKVEVDDIKSESATSGDNVDKNKINE